VSILMNRRQVLASGLALALPRWQLQPQTAEAAQRGTMRPADHAPSAGYPIRPIPFTEVRLKDEFWQPRTKTNAAVSIPFEFRKAADKGRPVNNNVLQAAIYSLQTQRDIALQAQVESRLAAIRKTEEAREGNSNSFFEVAAACFAATGSRELLDVAVRSADAIHAEHTTSPPPFSGGERDAINCIQLFKATNDSKHLELARLYLDIRGLPNSVGRSRHNQSYKPVLEQTEAVGHAVNCATLIVSMAEVGVLTGMREYFDAAVRMWNDTVASKMYVTGGIGSTGNEGFGPPYSLPNISAYAETCAGIMFVTLNHLLFLATGDGKYIDVMERAMYNNVVDGVSISGDHYFYVNRLASAGDGRDARWQTASLECCPPNLVRFMASMPGYVYAAGPGGEIYVNLYVTSEASFAIDQKTISLAVQSEMPWGGASAVTVSARQATDATIKLRIPGWALNRPAPGGLYSYLDRASADVDLAVNGVAAKARIDDEGYVSLSRRWSNGDVIDLRFPCETRRVVADKRVAADRGSMAFERGPIVYCAEGPDFHGRRVLGLLASADGRLAASEEETAAGRVVTIAGEARDISRPGSAPQPMKLVPYFLWAHREPAEMSVWLRTAEYAVGDVGPAGGFIFHVNPNWKADGWRYLEAAPCDQSEGALWGCFRTEIAGARGTDIGTGRQNTADILAACSTPCTAAALCASYRLNGIGGWFLPSVDELAAMYSNLKAAGVCHFGAREVADNFNYWSSSQVTADMARHLDFADNGLRWHYDDKDYPRRVRAIRAF
jgi:uncharacterized protein